MYGGLQMGEVQEAVRRHLTPLGLELQAIVDHLTWVLGAGLGSSVRAVLFQPTRIQGFRAENIFFIDAM